MIRNPLRPLIRVLQAREAGVDPKIIESEERLKRLHQKILAEKNKARPRIILLMGAFVMGFVLIGAKMFILASDGPEYLASSDIGRNLYHKRVKIVDRNGIVLATNLRTFSLYAHPHELIDKETQKPMIKKVTSLGGSFL